MKNFLENSGYKCWKEEKDSFRITSKFQKRIDSNEEFKSYTLCSCNDKLLLNIEQHKYTIHREEHESFQIFLCHANKQDEWANIKIYALNREQIENNLSRYEVTLLEMWEKFNELS
ncbi:hypothetical protein D3C85_680990 [compost metagenome]